MKKTAGSDIHAGVSVDQIAAREIGKLTRFASLELSCDPHRKSGGCDSGYSCAYESNLAWRSPTSPLSPESNPRMVFERLFGSGSHGERGASLVQRRAQQRSILDFVMDDAKSVQSKLTHRDKAKMDVYLTGVREIEERLVTAESFDHSPDPAMPTPEGVPKAYDEYIRLMYQMLALAFETDSTRVASLLLAHDGSNRLVPGNRNTQEGHHILSHHRDEPDLIRKVALIDRFYADRFAEFLTLLESKHDTDTAESLLHNSMISLWLKREIPMETATPTPICPSSSREMAAAISIQAATWKRPGDPHVQSLPEHARPNGHPCPRPFRRQHRPPFRYLTRRWKASPP